MPLRRPTRSSDTVAEHFDDETLLLDSITNQVCAVNPTGGVIWELIDGQRTSDQIAAWIATTTGAEYARAMADVEGFLDELWRLGYVRFPDDDAAPHWRRQLAKLSETARRARNDYYREVNPRARLFAPSSPDEIVHALVALRERRHRLVALGSGLGAEVVLASLLGFEAVGIEVDAELARRARMLAAEMGSPTRFFTGSFLPADFAVPPALQPALESFDTTAPFVGDAVNWAHYDCWLATPWPDTQGVVEQLFGQFAAADAVLLVYVGSGPVIIYNRKLESIAFNGPQDAPALAELAGPPNRSASAKP